MNFLQRIIYENNRGVKEAAVQAEVTAHPSRSVRVAIYDSPRAVPRIIDLSGEDYFEFINLLSTKTYQFSQEKGGSIPFTIIKEIVENLIHAFFNEVVISIFEDGNLIRFSDQGPGIIDLERAFQPGFSTASSEMKSVIKGVGSGLPFVRETMEFIGGDIKIDNNLNTGTVVTLALNRENIKETAQEVATAKGLNTQEVFEPGFLSLFTDRQKRVLSLITEYGSVGPSRISDELNISLSTAHRDLTFLEEFKLIKSDERGRRSLTSKGIKLMTTFFS